MTREEIEELRGLAASMGLYDDKNPCKRAVILGKAIQELEQESNCSEIPTGSTTKDNLGVDCISRTDAIHAVSEALERTFVEHEDIANKLIGKLPSVTPLSSGLEKNSKKLEKDFGESDCISRADVLKLMQDNWHTHNGDWAMQESMDDIRALPAVTPIIPKGHWIANAPQYDMLNPQYICSECGNAHTRITPYCEMCGAKMVEPQESEDKE